MSPYHIEKSLTRNRVRVVLFLVKVPSRKKEREHVYNNDNKSLELLNAQVAKIPKTTLHSYDVDFGK